MSGPTLPPALAAERRELNGRSGRLTCYAAGSGAPVLLLHSINAAASAYEVKPAFEHIARTHRVYAPDLPGYGFSDRSARRYDVALFCEAVRDLLDAIAAEHGATPVDVLALSLASEFAARVAVEQPQRFRTLTLVTPTGFNRGADRLRGAPGANREVPGMYAVASFPLWGGALFNALVSRASIRYFLKLTFGAEQVDEALVDYCWRSTHQPGAARAPFAFLSGRLFSADIRNVYEQLQLPVWLAHGTRGDFRDISESAWTRSRANWHVQPFDTGAMVYFEQPAQFCAAWDSFLAQAG